MPNDHKDQTETVDTATLAAVAAGIEALRVSNPMNGDGSNYMLNRCLGVIEVLAGEEVAAVIAAVREVQDARFAREVERQRRLREIPTPSAKPAPSPCSHGRRFCEECHGGDFL